MILIVTDNKDESACRVIDWLNYYKASYITLCPNDKLTIKEVDESGEVIFYIDKKQYSTQNISSTWYRRGHIILSNPQLEGNNNIEFLLQKLVEEENEVMREYFSKKIFSKPSLSSFATSEVNKLEVLYRAKEIGITIPFAKIINNKKELIKVNNKFKNALITKTVAPGLAINSAKHRIYGYTELIDDTYINELPEQFHLSLIQENINKKFELRSFFIEDQFYSMAIFSQENDKTKIDYRHYDNEKPNRFITFKLPTSLEKNLYKLMQELGLNNGSIDLIYGVDKQFYFIEVNPIGQYDMISVPCNNYLHKKIANYLIQQ